MAKKVIVLSEDSKKREGSVSRSVAKLMVQRLLWDWMPGQENRVAKILPVKAIPLRARSIRIPLPCRPYIPAKIPPAEVPQVHFKPPSSLAQWRDSHQEWLKELWLEALR